MWQDEAIPLIRALIDDYDNPFMYLDNKLEDFAIFAAHMLNAVSFQNTYTISISGCSITPDPSLDYAFINLMALQTACLIYQSEVKTYERQGVLVEDGFGGRTKIDTRPRIESSQKSLELIKKMLDKAKLEHNMNGGGGVIGQAIMTPRTIWCIEGLL